MPAIPKGGPDVPRDRRSAPEEIRNIYRARGVRGRQVAVIVTVLFLTLLLVADGLYVVVQLGDDLRTASGELDAGQEALVEGDLVVAESAFAEAESVATDANGLTRHPSLLIATLFPYVRDDAIVARSLPEVVRLTSEAGLTAVKAGKTLGGTTGTDLARAFYRDGRVQLDTLQEAEPYIHDAGELLREALSLLEDNGAASSDSLAAAIDDARERLRHAVELTDTGSTLMRTMPPLLGAERPARYLLVFQSNSEARGTGGLIALYGILEADDGRVNLTHVGPFDQLMGALSSRETAAIGRAPLLRRFHRVVRGRLEVNLSAHLPDVAPLLLQIYRGATGSSLDGVFVSDPPALASLMKATGPLPAPGRPNALEPDNVVKELLHDSYIRYANDPSGQNRLLIGIIKGFYDALGSGELDGPSLVRSFTEAVGSKHIKVYSVDRDLQQGLEGLAAAGSVASHGPNAQLVYHNNLANNKVDYYLEREIDTEVSFEARGDATVRTTVSMRNGAPVTRNPLTTSLSGIAPVGVNRMQLNMVMPPAATDVHWSLDGEDVTTQTTEDGGLPVAYSELAIAPGDTATVVMTYRLPAATDVLTGGDFIFALLPHATAYPDRYRLLFRPPPGFAVTSSAGGERVGSGSLEASGALDRVVIHEIQMSPL